MQKQDVKTICIIYSVYLVLSVAFYFFVFELMDFFTIFLYIFIALWVIVAHLVMLVVAVVLGVIAFRKYSKTSWLTYLPLIIMLFVILTPFFIPYGTMASTMNFYVNLNARNKVIRMVKDGELSKATDIVRLPHGYSYLSKSREVHIERSKKTFTVFFYQSRAILDTYEGFLYIDDMDNYKGPNFNYNYRMKKIIDHWYYIKE